MSKIKSLFLITVLFQLVVACSSTDMKTVSDERKSDGHYQLGLNALWQGDLIKAKREFIMAIDAAPDLPQYYNELGYVFFLEGDYKKAEENYRKALKIDKKYSESKYRLGILYLEQGEYEKALSEFNEVLDDTMYPYPYYVETSIGRIYRLQKRYDLAKQHLNTALKMRGTYCEAYKQMGLVYDEQNIHELAAENYKKNIDCNSADVEVLYRGALKMIMLQREEEWQKYLRRCLEIQAMNTKEISMPFLAECVELAQKYGVSGDVQRSPRKKQQIESVD
ncbi:tetratricopeptide repeat protein [bacterium]|nr:tetratricopeptide repeat protein [bacterium]